MSLPSEVTAFLRERISSLSELELMLLLHADAYHVWTARSASEALLLTESWIAVQLERFVEAGFAQRTGDGPPSYRWSLAHPQLELTVEHVAAAYKGRRTRVIASIYGGSGSSEAASSR